MVPGIKRYLLTLIAIVLVLITSCEQTNTDKVLERINDHSLNARISFISDDLTTGRAPGSHGSIIAQRYIASQMQQIGLQPGINDSSYYQNFEIVKIDIDTKMNLKFTVDNKTIEPVYYEEYLLFPGVQKEITNIENAELVFAGYGIQAQEFNWDDFKDMDVQGKVLLIMNNDPDTGDPDFFGGKARLYYGRWSYKYEQAARMGAAGAIIIHTTESAGYPWQVVQTSWSGSQFELIQEEHSSLEYKAWITEDIASRIVEMSGNNLDELQARAQKSDFVPVHLGIKVDCNMKANYQKTTGVNILGVLPGSDPVLSKEAVVITAHHDHLGIGKSIDGDSIYNGALDNASGVASILTLAEAFSELNKSPRRSLVFLAVDGEESGLLGSWYYAQNPTFSPQDIAANVNIDFINVWGKTRDVVVVGYGKSTIDDLVREYAKKQDRVVLPDLTPEQGMFYRSDQFSFAKIGVPGLYLDTGQDFIGKPEGWGKEITDNWRKTHYHQPSDEYDPTWDLSGHIEDLNLLFQVALQIADRDEMPAWLPGDEFEKVR